MASKYNRRSNKTKQLTYQDIINMTPEQLEMYGLGSWLKKNVGNLVQTVGGGLATAVGTGLIATGIGAPLGAALTGAGVGMMGQGVGGFANTAAQDREKKEIDAQTKKMEEDSKLAAMNQSILNNSNIPEMAPMMQDGGKVKRRVVEQRPDRRIYSDGTVEYKTPEGTYIAGVPVLPGDSDISNKLATYQGILGNYFINKYEGPEHKMKIREHFEKFARPDFQYDARKLEDYAKEIIGTIGDLKLSKDDYTAAFANHPGYSYEEWQNLSKQWQDINRKRNNPVDKNLVGGIENATQYEDTGDFGIRNMIARTTFGINRPYPYEWSNEKEVWNQIKPNKKFGGTINYKGELHEGPNGGIPVDSMGNPTMRSGGKNNASALVEGGEVSYSTPDGGTYIFSDTLLLDKNKTFSRQAKRIQSKYKKQLGDNMISKKDPIAKKGYDLEMQELIEKQEVLRDFKGLNQPQEQEGLPMGREGIYIAPSKRGTFKAQASRMGMGVQEAASKILNASEGRYSPAMRRKANFARNFAKEDGGNLPKISETPFNSSFLIRQPNYAGPISSIYYEDQLDAMDILEGRNPYYEDKRADNNNLIDKADVQRHHLYNYILKQPSNNYTVPNFSSDAEYDAFADSVNNLNSLNAIQIDNIQGIQGSNKFSTPETPDSVPYGGMNWADTAIAAAPGVIGSGLGLLQEHLNRNTYKPEKLNLSRITPQSINLGRSRASARETANFMGANARRSLKGATGNVGEYLSNIGNIETGLQRNLNEILGRSYETEESVNAQFRQQADVINAQTNMQEQMYNSQLLNQYNMGRRARNNQYISNLLGSVSGAIGQKVASNQFYDALNMGQPNQMLYTDTSNPWAFNRKIRRQHIE